MKKTVQIVTMPLNKEGWSHGDLLYDNTCKEYAIAIQSCIDVDWQAQQLLVLSDDNTKDVLCLWDDNVIDICLENNENVEYGNPKKIIASYPQLEGTLSISKEIVQSWIDVGTPGEGTVDIVDWNCLHPDYCKCYNQRKFQPFCKYYKDSNGTKIDPQGNLILEFGEKEQPVTINKTRNVGTSFDHLKPSIPTDEEIEEKAKAAAINGTPFSTRIQGYAYMYQEGYKQALKDLGYE